MLNILQYNLQQNTKNRNLSYDYKTLQQDNDPKNTAHTIKQLVFTNTSSVIRPMFHKKFVELLK